MKKILIISLILVSCFAFANNNNMNKNQVPGSTKENTGNTDSTGRVGTGYTPGESATNYEDVSGDANPGSFGNSNSTKAAHNKNLRRSKGHTSTSSNGHKYDQKADAPNTSTPHTTNY